MLDYWSEKINAEKFDALVLGGLAYKEGTDFLEESFMIKLGNLMGKNSFSLFSALTHV